MTEETVREVLKGVRYVRNLVNSNFADIDEFLDNLMIACDKLATEAGIPAVERVALFEGEG